MYSVWLPLAVDTSSRLQAALSVIPSMISGCLAANTGMSQIWKRARE